MKKSFLWPMFLLAFSTSDWQTFVDVNAGFSVETPGPLKQKELVKVTKIGELTAHTLWLFNETAESDNYLYYLTWIDYPAGTIHSDSTAFLPEFWEATVDEARASMDADLVYSSNAPMGEFPGVTWRFAFNKNKATTQTRAFLVKNRLYTMQAICKSEFAMNTNSDRFFNSFRFLK
jgi:hypothetical protein